MSHSSGDQQLGISRYLQKKDVNVLGEWSRCSSSYYYVYLDRQRMLCYVPGQTLIVDWISCTAFGAVCSS